MSRFKSTNYNPTGSASGNSSDGDYKERDSFLLGRMAIITFDLDSVGVYEGNYGQSIILNMDDVEVNEGVLSERLDDEKIKVFGWDNWFDRDEETFELEPLPGQDTVSDDDLPSVESQSAGGEKYRYAITDALMEGRDDPVSIGDGELWLSNGKKTRTLAKVLSKKGHDIIDEENEREDRGWLTAESDNEFQLRDELQGRRLMMWFEQVTIPAEEMDEDQDEDITFTDTVLLDADSESGITIANGSGGGVVGDTDGGSGNATDAADEPAEGTSGDDSSAEEAGFPEGIDGLIDVFARNNQSDREKVSNAVKNEAPDDYDVDMGAVMEEINNRG
jgi:hypothetical protein